MIRKYLMLLCAVVCDGLLMQRSFSSVQPVPLTNPPNCKNQVYWNLCNASNGNKRTNYINTLQRGDGKEDQEFRVKEIAVVNGVTLDLVVTVPTSERYAYTRKRNNNNFMHVSPERTHPYEGNTPGPPCWIVIPWKTQTSTKFHWKFVVSGDSDNKLAEKLASFTVGIVELDQEKDDDKEYVAFDTEYTNLIHLGTSILGPSTTGGTRVFQSLTKGLLTDNPSITGPSRSRCTPTAENPYGCINDVQVARTVRVEYEDRAEWELTIGHESDTGRQGDRFIEIYGSVCSRDPTPCTPNTYWDLCRKTSDYNAKVHMNVKFNQGTNKFGGDDEEFRIKEIAVVDGVTIDLVLKPVPGSNSYQLFKHKVGRHVEFNYPHVSPQDGLSREREAFEHEAAPGNFGPCWIVIPWKAQTATQWHWEFVETNTNTPKELKEFTLGVVELDQQENAENFEYVAFDTAYTEVMQQGGHLKLIRDTQDRMQVQSTADGEHGDNPSFTGPDKPGCVHDTTAPYNCLNDVQKAREFQVKFENKDSFDLTIGHKGSAQKDRFVEFYGTTCHD